MFLFAFLMSCGDKPGDRMDSSTAIKMEQPADLRIKTLPSTELQQAAQAAEASISPALAPGLELSLWGSDKLVADPISIDIDNHGSIYYTRTNRQKNSEFDIRGHREWETDSIALQSIDDKRAFFRKWLAPENSDLNEWMLDVNGDGSRDWRDMTVEKEHIYRVEDTDGDGLADKSQLVVEDFNSDVTDVAGAVLSHEEDLFVGVGPDLWRIQDTDKDGIADYKTSIAHGFGIHIGFSGHGMSGLEMGPDGRIYWGIGDIGFHGKGSDADGKTWKYPNRGVVVRSNPDGSDFEVFAMGVRNTHEFVFDKYGNLISVDNDGDHQDERERLVYLTNGSDSGWRINWQFGKYRDPDNNAYKVWMDEGLHLPRHDKQAAFITPPIASFINGPTGMVYNPGTALGPDWLNTFFVVEFVGNPAQSGIHAFKLAPRGASFELTTHQQFLKGILTTGLDFGPDGALYAADWIDGWGTKDAGRIWKIDTETPFPEQTRQLTRDLLVADFGDKREVELVAILKNPDMRVRQKAQFELARRGAKGAEAFNSALADRTNQLARIHAIWGINQLARRESKYAKPLVALLQDEDPEIRAQAAKMLGDARVRNAGDALIPLLSDDHSRARFFAAEALGRIAWHPALQPIVAMLEQNNGEDAYLRHAGSLALARIGDAAALVSLADHPSRALRVAAVVALRRMESPAVAMFVGDADEYVATEAARAINDDFSIPEALPALADLLTTTGFTGEPLIRRAINANLRVGTERALQNLLTYIENEQAPVAMRIEAIETLSTWIKPSVFDRVDGRYRGPVQRDARPVRKLAADGLIRLTGHGESTIRLSAVTALGKLGIDAGNDTLVNVLSHDTNADVRSAALTALAALDYQRMDSVITTALADRAKAVRVTGLNLLDKTGLKAPLMVSLLAGIINDSAGDRSSIAEKQSALVMLGKLELQHARPVFDNVLTNLEAGLVPVGIHLELNEAVQATKSAELIERLRAIEEKLPKADVMATYRDALYGGDADRARAVVFRHQAAQCARCHAFHDFGGTAGPQLAGIASRLSREQLLEALVNPNARVAPGYGIVMLELHDGRTLGGILLSETDSEVVIRTGEGEEQKIPREEIATQTAAPSSMPDMSKLLTKREIRDVVAFLAGLEE